MSRPCSICVLPEKERLVIDRKIVRGVPLSQIARESGFDRQVVERHKPHVHRQLLQVTEKNKIVASSFLLGEVHEILATVKRFMEIAEGDGETRTALIGAREWRETLKYVTTMAIDLKRLELEEKQIETPISFNVSIVDDTLDYDLLSEEERQALDSLLAKAGKSEPIDLKSEPFKQPARIEPRPARQPDNEKPDIEPAIDVEPAIEPVQKRFKRKAKQGQEPEQEPKEDEFEAMRKKYISPVKVPDEIPSFTDAELDEIDGEGMTLRERMRIRPLFERAH